AHPDFTLSNPNRARAVIFAMTRNFAGFHDEGGANYAILADQIIKIDAKNPQLAARLSGGFSGWRMMDAARQASMIAEIDRILARPNLSRDTTEILTRTKG
ncbi:MAG: aminopeptidase N C-terminal domain-containing protein, partial [Paracoccaceae bacterium]